MGTIIRNAKRVRIEEFVISYQEPKTGCGYSFPCDNLGNIDESKLSGQAIENLRKCRAGENGMVCLGLLDQSYTVKEPAAILCRCKKELELEDAWLNTCEHCGRDYNGNGQELAPREQWGEETGENWSDMVFGYQQFEREG